MTEPSGNTGQLLPCPFCGTPDPRESEGMYQDDDGERNGIECMSCDAVAPADVWNRRPVCRWYDEGKGVWETACGNESLGIECGPYCHFCGGKVEVVS